MTGDDFAEIVNLLNLYSFAIDVLRLDLFDRVFTADTIVDYGFGGRWTDLESFKRDFTTSHARLDSTQHTVANHQVIVKGDRANAVAYVIARLMRHVPQGGVDYLQVGGWYDDTLVRTSAGWRIKTRVCKLNWSEGNPRAIETAPGMQAKPEATSLRREADAGTIAYLKALQGR